MGGDMAGAIQYSADYGNMLEADYPYVAQDQNCTYDKTKAQTPRPTTYINIATENAEALQKAVAEGPVSVAIAAHSQVFQFYTGGILNSARCGTDVDHGVAVIGYGREDGKLFWIVRNSWGITWGEKGYVRIAIVSGKGICGIQMEPVTPNFV